MHIHQLMAEFTNWIHAHPHYGLYVAFFMSFIESLAIIGTIVPGAVTMTAIGSLIGANILPFWSSIIWIIFGAICGDILSFFAGYRYKTPLQKMWPLARYPQIITKGEAFFKKHGGKSVLIGRFFGPMRSAIPLVAGILQMPPLRFFAAAIPSAILWGVIYTFPGILIGALSNELPKGKATEFLIGIFTAILIVWLCVWAVKLSISKLITIGNSLIDKLWSWLHKHHSTEKVIKLITKRDRPKDHLQLGIILLASICFFMFGVVMVSVYGQGQLTVFNKPIFYALQSFRADYVTKTCVLLTFLGNKYIIFISTLLMSSFLLFSGHKRAAIHNISAIVAISILVFICKHSLHSPRPAGLAVPIDTNSFPSGHTALSAVFLSLSAYWITLRRTSWRQALYPIFIALIALVGLSRLYLGAHWLTDIIGSWLLAAGVVLITLVSYRRNPEEKTSDKAGLIFIAAVAIPFTVIGIKNFHKGVSAYQITWPKQTSSYASWWQQPLLNVPTYRPNRFGRPVYPFNVQWAAPLSKITQSLKQHGWKVFDRSRTLQTVLKRFGSLAPEYHMPLFAPLFQNKSAKILFIKKLSSRDLIECRLWRANLRFNDSHTPLWIGTINYHTAPIKNFAIKKFDLSRYQVDHSSDRFSQDLKGWNWKKSNVPAISIPASIAPLNWSGDVLIIQQHSSKKQK